MIYMIHALIIAAIYALLMLYCKETTASIKNSKNGVILDAMYIRTYILGVVVSISMVMVVVSPILSFVQGVSWVTIGILLLTGLICVVLGMQMILNIERLRERLQNSRKAKEKHNHDNKKYVRELHLFIYVSMSLLVLIPIASLFVEVLSEEANYFLTLILYFLLMCGVYCMTHSTMCKMIGEEREIREQIEKNDTKS